ncbi:MAG TPA: agmatine deiminase family protein [Blastocatellia bacterium]|nr:agmatine deiminase family protein [Blastocatellia bacterium]
MPAPSNPEPQTPAALGYRMPAEWEPHEATWLSWPHNRDSWPDKFEPVPAIFARIVKQLAEHEIVNINVAGDDMRSDAEDILAQEGVLLSRVRFHLIPTNDAWARDHGPIFITRQAGARCELAAVKWGYNAWGGKYPPFDLDDQVARKVGSRLALPVFEAGIILEGGSIDVNGRGSLLTTESCLLNQNRNPGMSKDDIEKRLKSYLGVSHVIWLGEGIEGDDTDGHIDDLARFVDPATIVTVIEPDPADPNHEPLRDNLARLQALRDQDGAPFRVVTLPMPRRMEHQGQRLPASYANFYLANNIALVPTFGDPADAGALNTLAGLLPGRRVVGIDCTDLVWGLGAIHCVTQQQPAI